MSPAGYSLTTLLRAGAAGSRAIATADQSLSFEDFANGTCLGEYFGRLEGRSIVLMAGGQLKTAAALVELDGWARRLVICPPDLEADHLGAVLRDA